MILSHPGLETSNFGKYLFKVVVGKGGLTPNQLYAWFYHKRTHTHSYQYKDYLYN